MTDRSKESQKSRTGKTQSGNETREDRLRAALRANLMRRKAQSRARSESDSQDNDSLSKDDTGGVDS